jgi:CRISPR/Cas system-associated exonuclease Cas4 (RecB family)
MKKSFLEYVATDVLNKYGKNLSKIAVVFPNKRASLFFNQELAKIAQKPIWSPSYITISELFRQNSSLIVADSIKLICDLYKCFILSTGTDETLDRFYGWGQLLLADFDDIDKNMADYKKIFANLKDIHEVDDLSYLDESQKEILKQFFSNFSENQDSILKEKFLRLWSHFSDIYESYNELLRSEGLAYEGALYRQVVENENLVFEYDTYIFIGFNVLQKVEQSLFQKLMNEGKAKFYWDFDVYYMPNKTNNNIEAGHFISKYLKYYPNSLNSSDSDIYDNFNSEKDITYISAQTENIQARYLNNWLRNDDRLKDGSKTAIVMCDENILKTVIHCLPQDTKANITTGYPLSQSPVSSLVNTLISLQTTGYIKNKDMYRMSIVNKILTHPYARYISKNCNKLFEKINIENRYYISREILSVDDDLSLLFKNIEKSDSYNKELILWINKIIQVIAKKSSEDALMNINSMSFMEESLFRIYTVMNRIYNLINSEDLIVDIVTLKRLIWQIISNTTIPFHGEPIEGVQIMGVLETRNLDFEHIILLSCNDKNMPKGVSDSSFIPHSLRKVYGLTTIDNKVAIYAYYFYSLIQRAKDITFIYNNSSEGSNTGEMSRFMLQLMVESNHKIKTNTIQTDQSPIIRKAKTIEKNDEIIKRLYENISYLSPTAINQYLRCPIRFFYNQVVDIKEPDNQDDDKIDYRMFGNIFHRVSELIYKEHINKSNISKDDINTFLKDKNKLGFIVDQAFNEKMFCIKKNHKYVPEYNGIQLINREVITHYVQDLLKLDLNFAPFSILGLEQKVTVSIPVTTSAGSTELEIGGIIDRFDLINKGTKDECIRVVDYKTGSSSQPKLNNLDEVFDSSNIVSKHSDYYLQILLYSMIIRNSQTLNPNNNNVSPALIFIQHASAPNYNPILNFGKQKISDVKPYYDDYFTKLKNLINEIYEPSKPFVPTEDKKRCTNCPYYELCCS